MFCKNRVLRNFAKLTGKHLGKSFFFNKVAGLKRVALLKKRSWHRSFPVSFAKFLRTPFLVEYLRWLRIGPFLGCQSIWYFSRNTIFSRINIIFFGDAGDVTPRCIFWEQRYLLFFSGGRCHSCIAYAYIQKIPYFHPFFDKHHLLSFSAQRKNIFSGKKKHQLSRYHKNDRVQVRISWKNHPFRTFENNIIFSDIFLRKIIFPFVSKE